MKAADQVPKERLILWVTQGFGAGRLPGAPGTFGSLVGLGWTALLLAPGSLPLFLAGAGAGVALSVGWTGKAERMLGRTDPASVVLDEIAAMPLCFLAWILSLWMGGGGMPSAGYLAEGGRLWMIALVFGLFRVFDTAKPWPVRQVQSVPGGWGITLDDLLAALYVNLVFGAGWALGWLRV